MLPFKMSRHQGTLGMLQEELSRGAPMQKYKQHCEHALLLKFLVCQSMTPISPMYQPSGSAHVCVADCHISSPAQLLQCIFPANIHPAILSQHTLKQAVAFRISAGDHGVGGLMMSVSQSADNVCSGHVGLMKYPTLSVKISTQHDMMCLTSVTFFTGGRQRAARLAWQTSTLRPWMHSIPSTLRRSSSCKACPSKAFTRHR